MHPLCRWLLLRTGWRRVYCLHSRQILEQGSIDVVHTMQCWPVDKLSKWSNAMQAM